MAAVNFRNATSAQGNTTALAVTLPTVVAGDCIVLLVSCLMAATATGISFTGSGNWVHQGTDSQIVNQLEFATYTAISTDGSESGATVTVHLSVTAKVAVVAASYSGVSLNNQFSSGPTYAQFTTSNTTSATSPSVSPVPSSWVLEAFTSKSTTNVSYTTPAGLTSRQQVFGTGAGTIDLALFDSNGIVSSGGGHTSTESVATGNKIAVTLALNTAPAASLSVQRAVIRASVI